MALAWTALTPRPTADAIFELDTASNWTEFRRAARKFAVPSQNLVYADTDGQHRLPGAGRDPDPQGRPQRRLPGRGLGAGERLDRPLRAVRRAAQRAQPARGLHRRRPTRRSPTAATATTSATPGTTATAASGSATCSPGRSGTAPRLDVADMADAAAGRPQPDGPGAGALPDAAADDLGVLRRRPAAAARLGLPPARGLRAGGVLQRGLEQRAAADLPRPAAREPVARRRPALDGGGRATCCASPTASGGTTRRPRASWRTAT